MPAEVRFSRGPHSESSSSGLEEDVIKGDADGMGEMVNRVHVRYPFNRPCGHDIGRISVFMHQQFRIMDLIHPK